MKIKNLTRLGLFALMLLSLLPTSANDYLLTPVAFKIDSIQYYMPHPYASTCEVYTWNFEGEEIVIPSEVTYEGYPRKVTTIRELRGNMISVKIPESVNKIRESAFLGCKSLTSIVIPTSVTEIEQNAFYNCSSLTSVVLPDSISLIPSDLFNNCRSLKLVEMSKAVQEIGNRAFKNCTSLASIVLPDSLTTIGESAFENCKSLKSVEWGNSVTDIGKFAFKDCSSLLSVSLSSSLEDGDKIDGTSGGRVVTHAFSGCKSLLSISMPNSINVIEEWAFTGCENLTSVVFPAMLRDIESFAFYQCKALTSVNLATTKTRYIGENAFGGCTSLQSLLFPSSLTFIGREAFGSCSSLRALSLPESNLTIDEEAFCNCSSLESLHIPDREIKIKSEAFAGCASLTSVEIPNSVKEVGYLAFSYCSSLTHIKLSENLERLDYGIVSGCEKLESLTIPGNIINFVVSMTKEQGNGWKDYAFKECKNFRELSFEYNNENKALTGNNIYVTSYQGAPVKYSDAALIIAGGGASPSSVLTYYPPIEKVFIDRALANDIDFPNLKVLTLGEHAPRAAIVPSSSHQLEYINTYAKAVPECPEFTQYQYENVIVKVPDEVLEEYKNAEGWKNFRNLEGFESSDVENITSEEMKTEIGRYDLNGKSVTADYKGILIIRYSDGSVQKILNK